MIKYAEKRDFLRMPIDCGLSFSKAGSADSHEGKVINLSTRGILFTSSLGLDAGDLLDIVLTPGNSITPPMRARVTVSRVESRQQLFEIAGQIEDVDS